MYDKCSKFALSRSFLFCLNMEIEHVQFKSSKSYFPRLTNRLIAAIEAKCKFIVWNFESSRANFFRIRAKIELLMVVCLCFRLRYRIKLGFLMFS